MLCCSSACQSGKKRVSTSSLGIILLPLCGTLFTVAIKRLIIYGPRYKIKNKLGKQSVSYTLKLETEKAHFAVLF